MCGPANARLTLPFNALRKPPLDDPATSQPQEWLER
jgi:hypothetical protein